MLSIVDSDVVVFYVCDIDDLSAPAAACSRNRNRLPFGRVGQLI